MSLVIMSKAEMEQILLNASRFSVYAAEEQIRQGYLTIQGAVSYTHLDVYKRQVLYGRRSLPAKT